MTEQQLAQLTHIIGQESAEDLKLRRHYDYTRNQIDSAYHDGKLRMAQLVMRWIEDTQAGKTLELD